MTKTPLLSIAVSNGPYSLFMEEIMEMAGKKQSAYICVANVHMLVEAHRAPEFANTVKNADIVTPDGKPLVWALRLLHGIRQDRVAGMDLLPDLLKASAAKGIPVFFYGGTEEMLQITAIFIKQQFPALKVAGMYSPPFRPLSPAEEQHITEMINTSGAGLLLAALGCPKQEKWMAGMKNRIAATMIGIGGALPVMVGMQKRAPSWMQRYGLEWLYRLLQEPRRLFKRYAVTNSIFLWLLLKAYLSGKKN